MEAIREFRVDMAARRPGDVITVPKDIDPRKIATAIVERPSDVELQVTETMLGVPDKQPLPPALDRELGQVKITFPFPRQTEYRWLFADGTWSDWAPAPDGILKVPPAAVQFGWRLNEAAQTAAPMTPLRFPPNAKLKT
jgi:hypothetical protein